MLYSTAHDGGPRRRRIVVAVVTAVALFAAVGTYAALSGSHSSSPSAPGSRPVSAAPPSFSSSTARTDRALPELAPTTDPELFVRSVAHTLFDWDTMAAAPLSDYTARLVAVADPTGMSSPGLVADIAAYLPTAPAWSDLRSYSTRQRLTIESVEVPSLWAQAEAQAGPDGLLPGTAAYTITGVRHRSGIWESDTVTSEHGVAFTVFIVCAPSYSDCRLLRLSRLNEPLN